MCNVESEHELMFAVGKFVGRISWFFSRCLSFQGHHKAAPGSHRALPLDEPSTATEVVSKYHLAF